MVRLLIAIALVSCTRTSEKYCGLYPEDLAHCPPSDAPDPRVVCSNGQQCPMAEPYCLIEGSTEGVCVECIIDGDCSVPGKQECDPETRTCRTCVEHSDCPASLACLPDGTCGDDDTVIYVDQDGVDIGTCTFANKCKTITFGLTQTKPTRFHMKLTGAFAETVSIMGKRVVMLAGPQTTLRGLADPSIKTDSATVTIYDLEVACTPTPDIGGVRAEKGSTLVLRNVFIHGCPRLGFEGKSDSFINIARSRIAENRGGGIEVEASVSFSITNTLIYRNGTADSVKGGVSFAATSTGMTNRFEHNTVADNTAKSAATVAGGVSCTLLNYLEMPHNIIAGNTTSNGLNPNTFGGCDFAKSLVEPDSATLGFRSTMPPYDYHLTAGSPALDKIEGSGLADDIDGQFRPQGIRKDYGADEFKP